MSIKCLTRVWEHSKSKGSALLVMLSLADNAKESGYCWPSYNTIAKRCRLSDRQVIRIIKQLQKDGELFILKTKRRKSNEYILWVWVSEPELKRCANCGGYEIPEIERFEIHHKIPISEGGSDEISNLEILCVPCHNEKHDKETLKNYTAIYYDNSTCDKMSYVIRTYKTVENVIGNMTSMSPKPLINRQFEPSVEEEALPFPFEVKSSPQVEVISATDPGRAIMEGVLFPLMPPAVELFGTIAGAAEVYGPDETQTALRIAFDDWKDTVGTNGREYKQHNYGWVEWGINYLATGKKQWSEPNGRDTQNSPEYTEQDRAIAEQIRAGRSSATSR